MSKVKPIKGYVYLATDACGAGKVAWGKDRWQQFLANFTNVKIESCDADEGKDYLVSARGMGKDDWKERRLIAEAYTTHPTR